MNSVPKTKLKSIRTKYKENKHQNRNKLGKW
jgi:hypothetical protein